MLALNFRNIQLLLLLSMLVASCSKPIKPIDIPKEEVVLIEKAEEDQISNIIPIETKAAQINVNDELEPTRKNVIIQRMNPSTLEIFHDASNEYNPTLEELDSGRLQPSIYQRSQNFEPTIYFRFNKSLINTAKEIALQAHINFLHSNKKVKIILEGHTDERGTSQYNLSLGLQRSIAIQNYLFKNGIDPQRIEVRTFGEERPTLEGHQESHWRYNRRVEIYYQQ